VRARKARMPDRLVKPEHACKRACTPSDSIARLTS
jgi:hypothetical protein